MASTNLSPRRTPRKTIRLNLNSKERRCKRCPDRPLLRECAHSAQARKNERQTKDAGEMAAMPSPALSPMHAPSQSLPVGPNSSTLPPLHAPPHSLQSTLSVPPNPLSLSAKSPTQVHSSPGIDIPIDPVLLRESNNTEVAPQRLFNPQLLTPASAHHSVGNLSVQYALPMSSPLSNSSNPTTSFQSPSSSFSQFSTPSGHVHGRSGTTLTPGPPYTQAKTNRLTLGAGDTDDESSSGEDSDNTTIFNKHNLSTPTVGSSASASSHGTKRRRTTDAKSQPRVRVSKKNQPFGRVKGVMRGNLEWNIPRRHPVEPYESVREERTKAFRVRMERIIQRCEELANVTGCWLYISSQIATSNHGFVHFASDALVRDANERMNDLHSFHSNMHTALTRATVRDVAQVEMENVQVRAELAHVKQSEAAARDSITELQQKLEAQEAKMNQIMQMLPSSNLSL